MNDSGRVTPEPPDTEPPDTGPADTGPVNVAAAVTALVPRLRQFVAVAREEHMSRAAELLGTPQPTLSRSIARLEADLGVTLFDRPGRTLRLTRHGRMLLAGAERCLAELDGHVRLLAEEVSPERGKVALAFLHTLGSRVVPMMVREFRARRPAVRFALIQGGFASTLDRLRAGEVDLCLVAPLPTDPDVATTPLDEQRIDLVVPAGHPLAGRESVRLAEAAAEEFVSFEPGYGLRQIGDDLCAAAGFVPHIAFEGEEADTVRGLVGAGLGVALLPSGIAEPRDAGVVAVRISEPPASRIVGLAWMADRPCTPPVAAFRDFVLGYRGQLFGRVTATVRAGAKRSGPTMDP
jgi:DNA-binding transcriptional LysR family regulator